MRSVRMAALKQLSSSHHGLALWSRREAKNSTSARAHAPPNLSAECVYDDPPSPTRWWNQDSTMLSHHQRKLTEATVAAHVSATST